MASDPQVFTFGEVAKHNHKKDCWLIVSGKVYDVTPFLDEHPGGDEVLLLAAEKDATDDFEDVGHSDSAREMMEKYYVGELDETSLPKKPSFSRPPAAQAAQTAAGHQPAGAFRVRMFQILTFIVVLGLAFALQYFGKKE